MRIAWFTPLPPARSGIAAYSAELLPRLGASFVIDSYPDAAAHDFVWRARQRPYDLTVYQLGNARYHDYMWAYLAYAPGLVVLHDARLHHARARQLLDARRFDDYRREFRYNHPGVPAAFAEYAVEGLGGPIYYFWSMLRAVMVAARSVAVHNPRVASDLREEFPGVPIDVIRMGVGAPPCAPGARARVRAAWGVPDSAVLFAAFGKITAEKRIAAMLTALATLAAEGLDVRLLLVGDAGGYPSLQEDLARSGVADRVFLAGHVDDEAVGEQLAAADAALCLRWPTALETSASWLRCLAAARPTVITDLAHTVDVPSAVALRVDLWDEAASLVDAMRRLATDRARRDALARAGHAYWTANHTLDVMAEDYRQVLAAAAGRPLRSLQKPAGLPEHFTADHSARATAVLEHFGVDDRAALR